MSRLVLHRTSNGTTTRLHAFRRIPSPEIVHIRVSLHSTLARSTDPTRTRNQHLKLRLLRTTPRRINPPRHTNHQATNPHAATPTASAWTRPARPCRILDRSKTHTAPKRRQACSLSDPLRAPRRRRSSWAPAREATLTTHMAPAAVHPRTRKLARMICTSRLLPLKCRRRTTLMRPPRNPVSLLQATTSSDPLPPRRMAPTLVSRRLNPATSRQ